MSKAEFEVGDRVKVRDDADRYGRVCYKVGIGEVGMVCSIREDDLYPVTVLVDNGETEKFKTSQLELQPRDLDSLRAGDVLIDEDGDEATVLAVLGDVFLRSEWNEPEEACVWYTVAEAKRAGFTLKFQTSDVTELSVADIEEKLDLPSGTLRVKKGD